MGSCPLAAPAPCRRLLQLTPRPFLRQPQYAAVSRALHPPYCNDVTKAMLQANQAGGTTEVMSPLWD